MSQPLPGQTAARQTSLRFAAHLRGRMVHATHEKRACRPGEEAGNGAVQQVVSPASLHPRTELGPIEPPSVAAATTSPSWGTKVMIGRP
jgi:hypothetical protein